MQKVLFRTAAVILIFSVMLGSLQIDISAETTGITDYGDCALFSREAVKKLVAEGIITGGTNGRFNPKGYVTRAQVVTLIIKSMGLSLIEPAKQTFKDLPGKHWSYQYIETAYYYGITAGTSTTTFSPDKNCTREEMVAMLIRANRIDSAVLGGTEIQNILNQLKDKDQISPWAKGPMAYAYSQGIISGYNSVVSPKGLATREQMAVILDNYMTRYLSTVNSKPVSIVDLTTANIPEIRKSVVTIMSYDETGAPLAQGSGFCIGNSLFLTNFHVLEYGTSYKIMTDDGITYDTAGIVKYDTDKDLAIIKSKQAMNIKPLNLGSKDTVFQGDSVVAIGSPLGLQNTVSNGLISGIREADGITLLQTSAPITHGSSGGPLFDLQGNVIGVTSSGYDSGNLNFAVPIDYAMDWIRSLSPLSFSNIPVIDAKKEFSGYYSAAKAGIIKAIDDLRDALTYEDLTKYKSILDPENPAYGLAYSVLTPIFEMYDLDYRWNDIKFKSISSGRAEVEFPYSVLKRYFSSPDFRERDMIGKYTFRFDGESWKITAMEDILVRYRDGASSDGNTSYDEGDLVSSDKVPTINYWLNMKVTDAVEDPVRPVIYVTDKAAKRLYAVNYETNKTASIAFTLPPEQLTFANGKIYVALLKGEHSMDWKPEQQKGAIAIVDALTFTLKKQFDINMDPYGIAADNNGIIYVNPGSGWAGDIKSFSEETGAEISSYRYGHTLSSLEFNHVTNTLYYNSNTSPDSLWKLEVDNGQFLSYKIQPGDVFYEINDNLRISPEGNYLFNGTGNIFYSSLNYVKTIRPYNDIAFNGENNRFYIGNDSNIYVYDYANLKPMMSYNSNGKITKLFYRNNKIMMIIDKGTNCYLATLALD